MEELTESKIKQLTKAQLINVFFSVFKRKINKENNVIIKYICAISIHNIHKIFFAFRIWKRRLQTKKLIETNNKYVIYKTIQVIIWSIDIYLKIG
jgi:hypothetical protein